jgi:hypothetical protein
MRMPGVATKPVGMAMRIVPMGVSIRVIVAALLRMRRSVSVALVLCIHLWLLYPSPLLASRSSLPC